MDWEILYNWLEQKSGVSYDLNESISEIGDDTAFLETFYWSMKIGFILDDMENAIEVVEDNWRELTEDLPPRDKLKKFIEEDIISKLEKNINDVKKKLGMSITPIKDSEDVLENTVALRDLISMLSSFSVEDLQKRNWFENYNENSEDSLTEVLELHKNDLVDIHQTIENIKEGYSVDDDMDDEDDEDEDMDE